MVRVWLLTMAVAFSLSCYAQEPSVSLSFSNASLKNITFSLTRQTHSNQPRYMFVLNQEMRAVGGISIDVHDVPLTRALDMLKQRYNLCSWMINVRKGLRQVRVSYCGMFPFPTKDADRWQQL